VDTNGIEDEVLEIAADFGLTWGQAAALMGCEPSELPSRIERAARRALWRGIAAFRGKGDTYAIEEPFDRKWNPWDRSVCPSSVARHPEEPEKWKAPALQPTIVTDQESGSAGCDRLVVAIDSSGSMVERYMGRSKMAWAKDAAAGLIAFAKEHSIPLEVYAFTTVAHKISYGTNYLEHMKAVLLMAPGGGTDPSSVAEYLSRCDEGTLIAIITDGEFEPDLLRRVTQRVKGSKVICAVIETHRTGVLQQVKEHNLEIFSVNPSALGVVVERAKKSF